MNEIKTVGEAQTARRSLLHKADSVITVGYGRGFVMERRVYFDFGDGNGHRKLRSKVVVTASHCLPHAPKVMSSVDYQLLLRATKGRSLKVAQLAAVPQMTLGADGWDSIRIGRTQIKRQRRRKP
jgi:hypothetical protein